MPDNAHVGHILCPTYRYILFRKSPYIPVKSDAGGVEAAMNALLVALGKHDPADVAPTPQPKAEPLEELVLELTDLKFQEKDGILFCSKARSRPAFASQKRYTMRTSTWLWRRGYIRRIEAVEMSSTGTARRFGGVG